jgi:hypothetical protein
MANIRVATNARYRKKVQLWSHNGTGNRQRVIQPRIAINNDWEWLVGRAKRSHSWGQTRLR